MLVVHLLVAVLVGVLAAALSLRAGASGSAALVWYFLVGMAALGISSVIERWAERPQARLTEDLGLTPGERRRRAVRVLFGSLLAVVAVLVASALGLVPVHSEGRSALLSGFMDPVFGLDHLLALLWLGLWAGRVRGPALWALPAAFLAGTVAGFGLALGPPVGLVLEAVVHLLVVASLLLLIGAALIPVRLPLREMASTEVSAAPALWFGLGVLVSSAALAAAGAAMGRMMFPPIRPSV